MKSIQKALLANALFSGLSGLVLIVFKDKIAHVFATSNTTVFWIVGTALIFFTATILFELKRQNPLGVLLIIFQDLLWVLASIILLIFRPFAISAMGYTLIAIVALIVLGMALFQIKALARIDERNEDGTKQLRFQRTVKATKAQVWKVISDVENYHKVAPNIDHVTLVSGKGEGLVRSCSHGEDSWTETCTLWEEEKQYAFLVNTNAPDYPYPLKYLKGTWKVEAVSPSTTQIVMWFDFRYKQKYQNWLLHPVLKRKFRKIVEELLDNWQIQLERW